MSLFPAEILIGENIGSIPFNMIDVNNQKLLIDFIRYPLVCAFNETNLITYKKKNLFRFSLFYYCLALLILSCFSRES